MYSNLAVLGRDINKNIAPLIYNNLLDKGAINGGISIFELKEADELPILLHFLERFSFRGINIISSYKSNIISYIENVDDSVTHTGFANLLEMTDNGWKAYNTEVQAFLEYFKTTEINEKHKILIIGAGNTAKAAILALKKLGVSDLTVICRSPSKIVNNDKNSFVENIFIMSYEFLINCDKFDIIINTINVDWNNKLWLDRFWPGRELLFKDRQPKLVFDLQLNSGKETEFLSLWDIHKKYNGTMPYIIQAELNFNILFKTKIKFNFDVIHSYWGKH